MAKRFARNKCDYTFHGLQNVITPAMESVTLDKSVNFSASPESISWHFAMGIVVIKPMKL